jgi:hypothetical protein
MYVPLRYFPQVVLVPTEICFAVATEKGAHGCRIVGYIRCEYGKRGGLKCSGTFSSIYG